MWEGGGCNSVVQWGNLVGGGERECIIPVIATLGRCMSPASKSTKAKKTSQKSKSIAAKSQP